MFDIYLNQWVKVLIQGRERGQLGYLVSWNDTFVILESNSGAVAMIKISEIQSIVNL